MNRKYIREHPEIEAKYHMPNSVSCLNKLAVEYAIVFSWFMVAGKTATGIMMPRSHEVCLRVGTDNGNFAYTALKH